MIRYGQIKLFSMIFMGCCFVMIGCGEKNKPQKEPSKTPRKKLSKEFKTYWYSGKAEITSYELEEARYGEMRHGKSVLIYVTEPFLAKEQVKADENLKDNIPVLKLNSTKNFLTGIYPYSIMSSCFYPVWNNQHAIKVVSSIQEWCGQQYIQLNNGTDFDVTYHSYFEGEADQSLKIPHEILEDELWAKIRIDPNNLPKGKLSIVPSMEYIKLNHKKLKAYNAIITLKNEGDLSIYELVYPELQRTLKISFNTTFPYTVENWSETAPSGFGAKARTLTSTAKKIKTIKTAYWQENKNSDLFLRDTLGL